MFYFENVIKRGNTNGRFKCFYSHNVSTASNRVFDSVSWSISVAHHFLWKRINISEMCLSEAAAPSRMWDRRRELAYSVDPVHVGADSSEDSGLLGVVAAEAGAEADDAVNLPASVTVLAVQGAARVPLFNVFKP